MYKGLPGVLVVMSRSERENSRSATEVPYFVSDGRLVGATPLNGTPAEYEPLRNRVEVLGGHRNVGPLMKVL